MNYHGETVVAIPGATKASQSVTNGQSMSISLSKNELVTIAELSENFI
ncbi:MAG: hypothetical protein ACFFDT_33765 [Candidatus Hodarchaeota archaeon]